MWKSLQAAGFIITAAIPHSMMVFIPFILEKMQALPIRKSTMVKGLAAGEES